METISIIIISSWCAIHTFSLISTVPLWWLVGQRRTMEEEKNTENKTQSKCLFFVSIAFESNFFFEHFQRHAILLVLISFCCRTVKCQTMNGFSFSVFAAANKERKIQIFVFFSSNYFVWCKRFLIWSISFRFTLYIPTYQPIFHTDYVALFYLFIAPSPQRVHNSTMYSRSGVCSCSICSAFDRNWIASHWIRVECAFRPILCAREYVWTTSSTDELCITYAYVIRMVKQQMKTFYFVCCYCGCGCGCSYVVATGNLFRNFFVAFFSIWNWMKQNWVWKKQI